jgi:hypothetical protein
MKWKSGQAQQDPDLLIPFRLIFSGCLGGEMSFCVNHNRLNVALLLTRQMRPSDVPTTKSGKSQAK